MPGSHFKDTHIKSKKAPYLVFCEKQIGGNRAGMEALF